METGPLLAIGILIIGGYFGGIIANKIGFPKVSGYLVVGILLSPSVLNLIPEMLINKNLNVIIDMALGIVAYLVGGSFHLDSLKKIRKDIGWVTFFEASSAGLFVALLILLFGFFPTLFNGNREFFIKTCIPMALICGAISAATAPAAVMAIIREYKARGSLTTTLLAVIALDDAIAIIFTAIAISIAQVWLGSMELFSLSKMFLLPLIYIITSIIIGGISGFFLINISKLAKTKQTLLVIVFGMIMFCVGITKMLNISPLLAVMALGFTVINKGGYSKDMFRVIDDIEDVIFAVFFTLAGAHFNLEVMKIAWAWGLIIVLGRFSGKFLGAKMGAIVAGSPLVVRKYLGLGLLPKAGVTVGLSLLIAQNPNFTNFASLLVNAMLASVIINELIAPPLTKYALFKAGEIIVKSEPEKV